MVLNSSISFGAKADDSAEGQANARAFPVNLTPDSKANFFA
jgi:hypothetical protein